MRDNHENCEGYAAIFISVISLSLYSAIKTYHNVGLAGVLGFAFAATGVLGLALNFLPPSNEMRGLSGGSRGPLQERCGRDGVGCV